LSGCAHQHEADTHTHGEATSTPNLEPLSYTLRASNYELFVEFPPFVLGVESRFAAHFTKMIDFKAVQEGTAEVSIFLNQEKKINDKANFPTSPGIFRLGLTPEETGVVDLRFIINAYSLTDTFFIKELKVYEGLEAAIADNPASVTDDISFLKEQAWKIDFGIEEVRKKVITHVVPTSGEILPVKSNEKNVVARSSGIVSYNNNKLFEGKEVRSGEQLFTISTKGLLRNNVDEEIKIINARFEKTKADYDRAKELLELQIIGLKEYELRKMEYSIAEAELQTISENYKVKGQSISATMTGIVKKIMVKNGQYVEEGNPLVEITGNKTLILQAEVSQSLLPKLKQLESAHFKTPYMKEVESIKAYNGRLISYGKTIDPTSNMATVLFELDNLNSLIPGSFAEIFLLTGPKGNELVIPKPALMKDYDMHYVYVQTGGESFEKREVKLGADDGISVQILSGLTEGEWVVTKGAYQIKMASMSSAIPAHGHEH